MTQERVFSLAELCSLADVSQRTVRYYISQGLLPPPIGAGPAARYTPAHLDRLRLVRRLQREHLPLAEIRSRMSSLTDDDVAALIAGPEAAESATVRRSEESALEYIRSILGPSAGTEPGDTVRSKLLFAMQTGRPPAQLALERRLYPHQAERTKRDAPGDVTPSDATPGGVTSGQERPEARAAAAIRSELRGPANLTDDAAVERAPVRAPRTPMGRAAPEPAPSRSQWERIALAEDIELHIRRPLSRLQNRRVERLIAVARELLEED